jgi:hypothetical protein
VADAPTWAGKAVEQVSAAVPELAPFQREFNASKEDPFVNQDIRKVEINRPPRGPRNPTAPWHPPTVDTQPVVQPPPTLVWPAAVGHLVGPSCVGVITTSQGSLLLVKLPGVDDLVPMTVGESVPKDAPADKQWILLEVQEGAARFKDPTGTDETLPIGQAPIDPPPKPPEDLKNKPGDAHGPQVINTPNGQIQLPPAWGGGQLRLPPNWQQNMTPEMQQQIQKQIMEQMMRTQNQAGGAK